MYIFNTNEMFILALVAISIVGVMCLGLLIILGMFTIRRKIESEKPITPSTSNPPQNSIEERLNALDAKIDNYHHEDAILSRRRYHENIMYIAWGFALGAIGLAATRLSTQAIIVSTIIAFVFVFIGWSEFFRSRRRR